jgi:deoxyribodipyrimidine photolyase-related protein
LDIKNYSNKNFYIWQRKKLDILVTKDQKPLNNKWSYDIDNRLPFPKDFKIDMSLKSVTNKYITEAQHYVNKHFKNNIGDTDVYFPIDSAGAKKHLTTFLKQRFKYFGPYEDAISTEIIVGPHSFLSIYMNTGILTPQFVVKKILSYWQKYKVNIGSVEAIIRQIIGWRSYVHFIYMTNHKTLVNTNFFNHKRKLSDAFYTASTMMPPVDHLIKKFIKYGYVHHIERLMVLSNFMLLCEINPKDVFRWFIELGIDAIGPNWVMEPNIMGMGQFSCGPLMMTRPYFSSSNYINKMSNWKKKSGVYPLIKIGNSDYEWYDIWDALYYNFVNNNKKYLQTNYATANSVGNWNRKSASEKKELIFVAKTYIKTYV